jgi:hypothetical protein
MIGIPEGNYVIANVFETTEYLEKFMAALKSKGIEANYFINPINGFKYVYLARSEGNEEEINAIKNNFKESYGDELWILRVENAANTRMATLNFDD